MYFRNCRPQKTWLDQCRKTPVSTDPSESNMVNAPNIVEICMAERSPYLLITVKAIDWQTLCVSDMEDLKTVS